MQAAQRLAGDILEDYGTNDPFDICDIMNVAVMIADLPESVRGFSMCIKGKHIVYLNQILEHDMLRQVCAHELGHIVLHPEHNLIFMMESTLCVHARFEREADQFCAALLFEPEMLAEASTIQELAALAGVETRIAIMMAEQAGVW